MITVDSTLKKCPYCAELIKVEAIKCKHCGELLDGHPDFRKTTAQQNFAINQNPGFQGQYRERRWIPGVAALISFLIPGGGQIYKGNVGSGILWFIMVIIGYIMLIVPGLVLHVICIVNAASGDPYKD